MDVKRFTRSHAKTTDVERFTRLHAKTIDVTRLNGFQTKKMDVVKENRHLVKTTLDVIKERKNIRIGKTGLRA